MKKILSVFIVITMIAAMFTVPALADSGLRSKMIYPVLDELMKNENKFSAVGFQGHVTGSYFNPTSLDSAYTDIYNRCKW